jgi:hypothetical protein
LNFLNEGHQVSRVLEGIVLPLVVGDAAWRVAAEGEDVGDARRGVALQDEANVGLAVADTGEVRRGVDAGLVLDPHHEIVRHLARGAARAVGYRDIRGLELRQLAHGFQQGVGGLFRLGREELKGERGALALEEIGDVHEIVAARIQSGEHRRGKYLLDVPCSLRSDGSPLETALPCNHSGTTPTPLNSPTLLAFAFTPRACSARTRNSCCMAVAIRRSKS